jgi:hypothetical protein
MAGMSSPDGHGLPLSPRQRDPPLVQEQGRTVLQGVSRLALKGAIFMRKRRFSFRSFFVVGLTTATMLTSLVQTATAGDKDKIGRLIAPVELDLNQKNHSLVYQGSYIVNAQGGCNDCHTNPSYVPGHDPFQGQEELINTDHYLAGGRSFGPTLVSPNITPDPDNEGKPAGLTRDEFIQLMRTGHDPADDHILQVMPWPVYGKMTDRDLSAIYEYLRAIPPEPGP